MLPYCALAFLPVLLHSLLTLVDKSCPSQSLAGSACQSGACLIPGVVLCRRGPVRVALVCVGNSQVTFPLDYEHFDSSDFFRIHLCSDTCTVSMCSCSYRVKPQAWVESEPSPSPHTGPDHLLSCRVRVGCMAHNASVRSSSFSPFTPLLRVLLLLLHAARSQG